MNFLDKYIFTQMNNKNTNVRIYEYKDVAVLQ